MDLDGCQIAKALIEGQPSKNLVAVRNLEPEVLGQAAKERWATQTFASVLMETQAYASGSTFSWRRLCGI